MGKIDRHTLELKEKNLSPGPGGYEIKQTLDKKGYGFGKQHSPKIEQSLQERAGVPGPGNYEGNYAVGKRGSPKVQFGTIAHETSVKKGDAPGPGSYESPNKLGKRGISMHGLTSSQGRILSQDNEIAKNTPGPG